MNTEVQGAKNNIMSLKDEFCVWNSAGKASLEYDVSEEYVLPDYLPDIKKLLLVKAKTEDDESVIRDGKAEYSGNVVFYVIYRGENGLIKAVTQSYPYTNYVSLDTIYEDSIIDDDTIVTNRSVRAVSPRKLLLKAKVTTELAVYNKLCVSPRLVGGEGLADEFTLERSVDEVECVNYRKFTESDIRVSEDIEYKGNAPIKELVWCDADIFMTDCKYSDGKLNLKGSGRISCLVGIGDEDDLKYDLVEKNVIIDRVFDINLPFEKCMCYGRLVPGAFECGIANDSYGESRIIEIDFVCCADITAVSNEMTVFTNDVFSTAYGYENVYKEVETEKALKCGFVNFTVDGKNDEILKEKNDIATLLMSDVEAEITDVEQNEDKCIFKGQCNVRAVMSDNNGECAVSDFSFPVKFEMPLADTDDIRAVTNCRILNSKVSFDGSNVNVIAEIELMYAIFEKVTANTVSQITVDKNNPLETKKEKTMILYYPEPGETLWSVAKKYNVSRESVERANNKPLSDKLPRVIVIPVN